MTIVAVISAVTAVQRLGCTRRAVVWFIEYRKGVRSCSDTDRADNDYLFFGKTWRGACQKTPTLSLGTGRARRYRPTR